MRPLWFHIYIRQDESVLAELLNVVEHISDEVDGNLFEVLEPALDDLEDVLAGVGLANVQNDIFCVGTVNAEHLRRFILVGYFLHELLLDNVMKRHFPRAGSFAHYARER